MNWKAVGLESGKIYATGTHAECSRAVNEGISNIDERANAAITHTEAIRVMREDEYIRSDEEELELIEEKMRQAKAKKHIQLEAKKAALADEKERKLSEEERKSKMTRVHNFDQEKWTTEEEAYIKTNIHAPNKELLEGLKERFGKTVTLSALNGRKHKLRKQHNIPAIPSNRWKPEEDEYILKNYHRMTAAKIGEAIDRTTAAVGERVCILRRLGKFDNSERREPEQDNWSVCEPVTSAAVHESGEHLEMGVVDVKQEIVVEVAPGVIDVIEVERAEKMDTTQIIKPEKGDKTALHMTICKQLNQTYQAKNADYGDSFGETYRKLGIISAVTRISDKTNRLISLAGKPEADRRVKDETLQDTLMDLANYALLTLIELEEAK